VLSHWNTFSPFQTRSSWNHFRLHRINMVQRFILNWNFEVSRYTGRIVFCQVCRICKLKSIYTMDKLYRWTVRSSLVIVEYELCSRLIDLSLLIKIILNFCRLSSHLKFDSGRSIGRAAVIFLLVNMFELKVRSELCGCVHTEHLMNNYGYNLGWLQPPMM